MTFVDTSRIFERSSTEGVGSVSSAVASPATNLNPLKSRADSFTPWDRNPFNYSKDSSGTYGYEMSGFEDAEAGEGFIIYDPSTGRMVHCKTEEDKQAFEATIEEYKRSMLMVSSSGSPESIRAITASLKKDPDNKFLAELDMSNDKLVVDAVKLSAKSMTLQDLMAFAGEYPEAQVVLTERLEELETANIPPQSALTMTSQEISDYQTRRIEKIEDARNYAKLSDKTITGARVIGSY